MLKKINIDITFKIISLIRNVAFALCVIMAPFSLFGNAIATPLASEGGGNGTAEWITLNPNMFTLVSGATAISLDALVDEQELFGTADPENNSSTPAPNSFYNPSYGDAPVFTIDLGEEYNLTKVAIHDHYSSKNLIVSYWANQQWNVLFTWTMEYVSRWRLVDVDVSTAKLKFEFDERGAQVGEIGIKGFLNTNDEIAPADITDLSTSNVTANAVSLSWTAPGSDGNVYTAAAYDIRYSTSEITSENFANATRVTGVPAPQEAGSAETFTITGLNAATTYYFAIKTADEASNVSGISNVINIETLVDNNSTGSLSLRLMFDQAPSNLEIQKAALKFNKQIAYSLTLDDGLIRHYTNVFKILNGGIIEDGRTMPGFYYSNGCGDSIAFKAGLAINASNIREEVFGNWFSWNNLREMYNAGWDILNHSYTHAAYNNPQYQYEILQNTAVVLEKVGFEMTHFVIPSGDRDYYDFVFDNGMVAMYDQNFHFPGQASFSVDGELDLTDFRLYRAGCFGNAPFNGRIDDNVYQNSINGKKYWVNEFTHNVAVDYPNGGTNVDEFIDYMSYIETNYGCKGSDIVWMAPLQEVYEYLFVREFVDYSITVDGNVVDIVIDINNIPAKLRRKSLTLNIVSNENFNVVSTSGFANHSYKGSGSDKIINLEWLVEGYSNDTIAFNSIQDLNVLSNTGASITLNWTAPGKDSNAGTASAYDIRYSTSEITAENFDIATQVTGIPAPQEAGSAETVTVTGLNPSTTYYFAIKTVDGASNVSGISNVANATTSSIPANTSEWLVLDIDMLTLITTGNGPVLDPLVDEQSIFSTEPVNNQEAPSPESKFSQKYGDPQTFIIDLGTTHYLEKIAIHDWWGSSAFNVSYFNGTTWIDLFSWDLSYNNRWRVVDLAISTSQLKFQFTAIGGEIGEIGLKGYNAASVENRAPEANAGSNNQIAGGMLVTLNGSASSDPDGDEITYLWSAPDGIELNANNVAQPTFIAPQVDDDTPYEFTLVVSDGELDSKPDTVVITVLKPIPTISQCAHQTLLSSGGDAIVSEGSFSFSFGQFACENIIVGKGSIAQGVQLPYELFQKLLVPLNYELVDTLLAEAGLYCFNALETITIAGGDDEVIVHPDVSVNFIAGQTIRFLPGFHAQQGSYVSAKITTSSDFCVANTEPLLIDAPLVIEKSIELQNNSKQQTDFIRGMSVKVYPNPNSGRFIVELDSFENTAHMYVYNQLGALLYDARLSNIVQNEIELPLAKSGLYYIRVISDKLQFVNKIIVN